MATGPSAPLLTIAVPFYKNVEYYSRAVESVFSQAASSWVVLLVDNSLDDRDHGSIETLAARYPPDRLRHFRNEKHLNACENFNRCIDLAETDLVSIVHGDDEVLPRYADDLLSLAARHPEAAMLFLAARIIGPTSQPCFSFVDWFKLFLMPRGDGDFVLSGEASLCSIVRGNWINGGTLCYRKSRLGEMRWDPRYQMTADLDLFSRVILAEKVMAGTRRPPSYSYRRHLAQTTAELSATLYRFREESLMLDIIADRASRRGWSSAAKAARNKAILQLHLSCYLLSDAARFSLQSAREKLRLLREIRATTLTARDP